MKIDVITLFPDMFAPLSQSILGRAQGNGKIGIAFHDLRDWGLGKYKQTDDKPYGGGAGMVMRVDVLARAIEEISGVSGGDRRDRGRQGGQTAKVHRILLSAKGKRLTQSRVEQLAKKKCLLLVCGHYEGVDQRIVDGGWIDEEISIGEYVLTGGELPAMVLIDAVARQLPGVLGKDISAHEESFSSALGRKKEYPHYTRPEEFQGLRVPDILLSGHHGEVEKWRKRQVR